MEPKTCAMLLPSSTESTGSGFETVRFVLRGGLAGVEARLLSFLDRDGHAALRTVCSDGRKVVADLRLELPDTVLQAMIRSEGSDTKRLHISDPSLFRVLDSVCVTQCIQKWRSVYPNSRTAIYWLDDASAAAAADLPLLLAGLTAVAFSGKQPKWGSGDCGLRNEHFEVLRPTVQNLRMGFYEGCSALTIDCLRGMGRLQRLTLCWLHGRASIHYARPAQVAATWTNLRHLEVYRSDLSVITMLSHLPKLEVLQLLGCIVSDTTFDGMPTAVRHLELRACAHISESQLRAVRSDIEDTDSIPPIPMRPLTASTFQRFNFVRVLNLETGNFEREINDVALLHLRDVEELELQLPSSATAVISPQGVVLLARRAGSKLRRLKIGYSYEMGNGSGEWLRELHVLMQMPSYDLQSDIESSALQLATQATGSDASVLLEGMLRVRHEGDLVEYVRTVDGRS